MMEPPKHQLRIVSWNTIGIRYTKEKSSKLQLVLDNLIRLKADVAFLQETHIGQKCYKALENITGWRSYFTVHHPRSKGVAILIKNETIFRYLCHDEDYSGGYIVLFCRFHARLYTLVNVYNHQADRYMLGRLRDYLTAINTKGVLVVGGDFNTVLDPAFDRKSSADQAYQSSLRSLLEDFTQFLSLKDVFAAVHPMKEGFTRSQSQSHSRLDMFFLPENITHHVEKCENVKGTMRQSTTGNKRISDHDPLVLDLKVSPLVENKIPEVASMLKEFQYRGAPDRRTGKINAAEILNAIRSLPDSQQKTPDKLSVYDYKKNDLPLTEILKINYNLMLRVNHVPECFVESLRNSDGTHSCNIDYLIFTRILAKRLKVFLTSSFRKVSRVSHSGCIIVTLAKRPQKIKRSFLQESLSSLKHITPTAPKDFTILENLLPKSNDSRKLHQGCTLSANILTMALKHLGNKIKATSKSSGNISICNHRQSLLIYTDDGRIGRILKLLKEFKKSSGLRIHFSYKPRSSGSRHNLSGKLGSKNTKQTSKLTGTG
ncbi:uncharacterized protein LOC130243434 [Danio aesculapii]|uniref:uncharacterized protein LOC130243434 n=1 Tax=Danio aesculapii TaxID=1142201 RepID=UPI0024BFE129|nr:uncharacterized protein LOC130243434 [Danio aesculapii]